MCKCKKTHKLNKINRFVLQNNSQPKHWINTEWKNKLTYKNKQKRVLIQKYTQHTKKLLADVTSQSVAIWQPGKWASTPTNCTFNCSGTAAAAMIRAPPRVTHCSSSLTAETFIISCDASSKCLKGAIFLRKVFLFPSYLCRGVKLTGFSHPYIFSANVIIHFYNQSLHREARGIPKTRRRQTICGPTPESFTQPMTADITWYYKCTPRLSGTCWICGLRGSNSPRRTLPFDLPTAALRAKLQALGNSLWTRVSSKS